MSIVAAGVFVWRPIAAEIYNARLMRALEQARAAASIPSSAPRLSSSSVPPTSTAQALKAKRVASLGIASQLTLLAERGTGDSANRAKGVAHYLGGDCPAAVSAFEAMHTRDARDWNDLAAAEMCAAKRKELRADRWLSALAATDRALAIDPFLREAQFNRAMILESLGVPRARTQWLKYVANDPESAWATVARQHIRPVSIGDADIWRATVVDLNDIAPDRLAKLTKLVPEEARRYAEGAYLPLWAKKVQAGDHIGAQRYFEQIRVIANTLETETGETLLADTLRSIDASAKQPSPFLLKGLAAYYEGRYAYSLNTFAFSEAKLREAHGFLQRAGCPLAKVAEFYESASIGNEGRTQTAQQRLYERAMSERAAGTPHKALLAHTLYELAMYEALLGHWSLSMTAANESLAIFTALNERQNAAAVYAVLAEDYDLMGQREQALSSGIAGLHATCALGDYDRARVMLATLCRTELRAGEAAHALSLASLEQEIAPLAAKDAERHDADMFVRRAAAQWRLGKLADARRSLELARTAARQPADASTRTKLLADIDAAEGSFLRRRDPGQALALLSSAIDFQRAASRPIVLPELYLQRGRAYLAVNDLAAAEGDFEAGLAELERQRTRVNEAELRPGIFDDASELFDEAIALQIRKGANADAILRQVERGRARAVLEQLNAGDDSFVAPDLPRVADIQRELSPKSALLEYVALPDRLVVFVITRERAMVRTTLITRDALTKAASDFVQGRGADGRALYDMLIAPIEAQLFDVSALNVVADDFLQRVPFGALFDRKSRTFLVQRYTGATSPSAGVLLATLARSRRLPSQLPNALMFANPTIPREQYGDLPSLSASEYEAPRIARRYADAQVFVGDDATADRFRELAPSHDIVQFAGHGVINEREPYSSALVFAAGGVTAHDIARMKFRSTRVVVLAACSTFTGRRAAVDGVPSLARAFVVAGVPAVVGTLWDIDDTEAVAITRPLHDQLARGVAPADALRFAQLAAIRKGLPPSQWSAFALMGSASALAVPARGRAELAAK